MCFGLNFDLPKTWFKCRESFFKISFIILNDNLPVPIIVIVSTLWFIMKFTTNDLNVFISFAKKNMSNITFVMIKPDAVERGLIGNILRDINDAGFNIKALKLTKLSIDEAKSFYSIHSERPFFDELTKFMSRSPIVAALLEKENAVSEFRNLIGDTDPLNAKDGTIRNKYAISKGENSVHGSDSDENAKIEAQFHFSGRDILL